MTLASLLAASRLPYKKMLGVTFIPFSGERERRGTIEVRESTGAVLGLYVDLHKVRRGKDRVYRSLLEVSFQANYIKAFRNVAKGLGLAAEVPLATLDPESLIGLCSGLAAMADIDKDDLLSEDGLKPRLSPCTRAEAEGIALDGEEQMERLKALLGRSGLPCRERGPGVLTTTLRLASRESDCTIRALPSCLSFGVFLGRIGAYGEERLGWLLTLNWMARVAKCGLDSNGDATLLYEVPALYDGLIDHLLSQFNLLLTGAAVAR
jgi:hypothetical protein